MAERKIKGKDIVLTLDTDLVVCLTSQSLTRATATIDSASKCGADQAQGKQTLGIDFEGHIIFSPDANRVGISALHDWWEDGDEIPFTYGPATPVTGDVVYSGTAFIAKLDETAGLEERATFSASLGIVGAITKTVTV
jgi:hypothetical protein